MHTSIKILKLIYYFNLQRYKLFIIRILEATESSHQSHPFTSIQNSYIIIIHKSYRPSAFMTSAAAGEYIIIMARKLLVNVFAMTLAPVGSIIWISQINTKINKRRNERGGGGEKTIIFWSK